MNMNATNKTEVLNSLAELIHEGYSSDLGRLFYDEFEINPDYRVSISYDSNSLVVILAYLYMDELRLPDRSKVSLTKLLRYKNGVDDESEYSIDLSCSSVDKLTSVVGRSTLDMIIDYASSSKDYIIDLHYRYRQGIIGTDLTKISNEVTQLLDMLVDNNGISNLE